MSTNTKDIKQPKLSYDEIERKRAAQKKEDDQQLKNQINYPCLKAGACQ